jgi:hypothetical protein
VIAWLSDVAGTEDSSALLIKAPTAMIGNVSYAGFKSLMVPRNFGFYHGGVILHA